MYDAPRAATVQATSEVEVRGSTVSMVNMSLLVSSSIVSGLGD